MDQTTFTLSANTLHCALELPALRKYLAAEKTLTETLELTDASAIKIARQDVMLAVRQLCRQKSADYTGGNTKQRSQRYRSRRPSASPETG
jgi:hypothetical protein